MAEPAIRAIATRFPGARLDVQAPRPLVALARTWRFADEVLPVYAGFRVLERLDRMWAPVRLRRQRFDLCVLFPNARDVADLTARARIPRRVGYARDGREALLTDPVPSPETPRALHMVVYYWGLAAALGCGPVPVMEALTAVPADQVPGILARDPRTAPRLEPTDAMLDAGRQLLRRAGLAPGRIIAIAPGAAYGSAKRWPASHFGALCRRLTQELGQPCAILGSAGETRVGAAVHQAAGAGRGLVDLTGRTELGPLIGVLASASLFVGNDSGPAHLAAALGRPGLTLFGSTSEGHSGPVGPRMRTLHRHLPCSPCFERECPLGHLDCLNGLAVDEVVRAARDAVDGSRP